MLEDTTKIVPTREAAQRRKDLAQGPRRHYPLDFKLQVMKEIAAPGVSVAAVARRHGMNANVIFRWRKNYCAGTSGENTEADFLPVRVVRDAPALPAPACAEPPPERKAPPRKKAGRIEITLPGGFALRVDEGIDEAALRRVLCAVRDLA